MPKSYLLVYSDAYSSQEKIIEILNRSSTVIFWRYDMPNTFYLTSNCSAYDISAELSSHLNSTGKYIVLEYNGNAQGSLTDESWYLLNNKHHKQET